MLQFYLREEGLMLSWVGTGRIIFSLNYSEADFDEVVARFTRACERMEANGWWWHAPERIKSMAMFGNLSVMTR